MPQPLQKFQKDHTYDCKAKSLFSYLIILKLFYTKDWTDSIDLAILKTPELINSEGEGKRDLGKNS